MEALRQEECKMYRDLKGFSTRNGLGSRACASIGVDQWTKGAGEVRGRDGLHRQKRTPDRMRTCGSGIHLGEVGDNCGEPREGRR
eukprot:2667242-Pyramimonas_sp.AAC.1